MAFLDDIFAKPDPIVHVRGDLHRLYAAEVQVQASDEHWDEVRFCDELKNTSHYLNFLRDLRDVVEGEIKSVVEQLDAVTKTTDGENGKED